MNKKASWYVRRINEELIQVYNATTIKHSWHMTNQDGRVVKALDLSSNGQMSAWVRTPLLVNVLWRDIKTQLNRSPISIDMIAILYPTKL